MLIPESVLAVREVCRPDGTRYQLSHALFERIDGGRCRAVATDGIRLVVVEWSEETAGRDAHPTIRALGVERAESFSQLVPGEALGAMAEAVERPGGGAGENWLHLTELADEPFELSAVGPAGLTYTVGGAFGDGNFPPWQKLVQSGKPAESGGPLKVDPGKLGHALTVLDRAVFGDDYDQRTVTFSVCKTILRADCDCPARGRKGFVLFQQLE